MPPNHMALMATGPTEPLLYGPDSIFTHAGYSRVAPYELEVRDLQAHSGGANLGATAQFIIPKAADLLGPVDLMIEFNKVTSTSAGSLAANEAWGWVDSLGYAMIEKLTFLVGSHEVEVLRGEELNLINELMTTDRTNVYS